MKYGICHLSVIPVRRVSTDTSEMVSQLLFGETFEIISKRKGWGRIRCLHDNYEGWIDLKQCLPISENDLQEIQSGSYFSLELVQPAMSERHYVPVLIGSNLPAYDGMNFKLNGSSYTFSGQVINPAETEVDIEHLIKIARKYLYAPYLWGGRSPFGLDCSGFVQVVYKMIGIKMNRDANQQVYQGELIDFIDEVKPGDLAFFKNSKGRVVHVGIILPEGQIIHASGQVRIDKLDHFGIFNESEGRYTHELRVVKRVLPNSESSGYALPEKHQVEQNSLF
ncbi:MAG: C40 family peptidase [Bacteroidota bacterium]